MGKNKYAKAKGHDPRCGDKKHRMFESTSAIDYQAGWSPTFGGKNILTMAEPADVILSKRK